ncbi:type II toxin-antitoxin system VapC family toxin [Devosia salina]|uniref:Ribonuclease VapC n=1 Tax=Devosia salina TaxID=2860336 RepID=A0ABX8WH06_9HYPH|nr:type II toxin-antitoxin system VapC family toxin [Devosia salina]QYO77937.1 type II toxin-antitoxin system VapC family toxin [Devosia salina]
MSLLLDTNVLSDLRRNRPGNAVLFDWRERVQAEPKYISVVSILELEFGVLQAEHRQQGNAAALRRWLDTIVIPGFAGATISVDVQIALACAKLQRIRTLPANDALIAATALVHNLTIVTRNTADFAGLGVELVNPWVTG